jgi:hypothetical protein
MLQPKSSEDASLVSLSARVRDLANVLEEEVDEKGLQINKLLRASLGAAIYHIPARTFPRLQATSVNNTRRFTISGRSKPCLAILAGALGRP